MEGAKKMTWHDESAIGVCIKKQINNSVGRVWRGGGDPEDTNT